MLGSQTLSIRTQFLKTEQW